MRILVTNDDGIEAEGLQTLAQCLANRGGEIFVVAPEQERSASGHSITLHRPIRMEPRDLGPGIVAQSVDGTPVDCVKLAVQAFMTAPPDLLISGINHGANLGRDVFYSGTVSAAIEGCFLGIPSVAVSLQNPAGPGFSWAAAFVVWWLARAYQKPPPGVLYNINLPRLDRALPQQMITVPLGQRLYRNALRRSPDHAGGEYFWLAGEALEEDEGPNTDVGTIRRGQVSITPLRLEITAQDLVSVPNPARPIDQAGIASGLSSWGTLSLGGGLPGQTPRADSSPRRARPGAAEVRSGKGPSSG